VISLDWINKVDVSFIRPRTRVLKSDAEKSVTACRESYLQQYMLFIRRAWKSLDAFRCADCAEF